MRSLKLVVGAYDYDSEVFVGETKIGLIQKIEVILSCSEDPRRSVVVTMPSVELSPELEQELSGYIKLLIDAGVVVMRHGKRVERPTTIPPERG